MIASINNVSVRGYEEGKNKKGEPYLVVNFEDEAGKICSFIDKNTDRKSFYTKGKNVNMTVNINTGRYTMIYVTDIEETT